MNDNNITMNNSSESRMLRMALYLTFEDNVNVHCSLFTWPIAMSILINTYDCFLHEFTVCFQLIDNNNNIF